MKREHFTVFGKKILDESGEIFHYPLQKKHDLLKFWGCLIVLPAILVVAISAFFGQLLSNHPDHFFLSSHLYFAGIHLVLLLFLLILMWVPQWLAVVELPAGLEYFLYIFRTVLLIFLVGFLLFPHNLIGRFFNKDFREIESWFSIGALFSKKGPEAKFYSWIFVGVCLAVLSIGIYQLFRSAYRDIRAGKPPRERKYVERLLWFDSTLFMLIFLSLIVVELWAIAGTSNYLNTSRALNFKKDPTYQFFMNYDSLYQERNTQSKKENTPAQSPDTGGDIAGINGSPIVERNMKLTAWFTGAVFSALVLFMWPFLVNRLMKGILIPVTFHERDIRGVVLKSYRYLWHFYTAMLLKHPFIMIGGMSLSFVFLLTPIIFVYAGRVDVLDTLTQPDHVILGIGVFLAWMSPLISAIVRPDETFAEYFNHRIVNHLLMVQGHVAIIGFGSLGKRVLDRDVRLMREKQSHQKTRMSQRRSLFQEIVTPDIRLEVLCINAIVVEQEPRDLVFSGENSLLGTFGVVSTCQETYKLRDTKGKAVRMEHRILVPALVGRAQNPFTFSRGNLERSNLLISTISDWEGVQNIFEEAYKQRLNAIISVSSSNQIFHFTHRARNRKIVLVYPRHNQGGTLGYRLWSAILKVRSLSNGREKWPNILVLGNNKANHFMLETLWTLLPVDPSQREAIIQKYFRFVVTIRGESEGHPMLRNAPNNPVFDTYWPTSFVAGSRMPYKKNMGNYPHNVHIQTRMINEVDVAALEDSLATHKPEIIIINHKNFESSSVFVVRCIQALERLRIKWGAKQPLPIILISTTRGNERERQILGDVSRYYDGICRFYNARIAGILDYPAHARYDHFVRELHGETVVDSLADASEIIAGARRSFARDTDGLKKRGKTGRDFIEISACLPNRPAALANYLARLSRLKFAPVEWDTLRKYWQTGASGQVQEIMLPSFQYLRHSKLDDPDSNGFVITGYATIQPVRAGAPILNIPDDDKSLLARIFANDGQQYVDQKVDPMEDYPKTLEREFQGRLENIRKNVGDPPGVPEVIKRVAGRSEYNKDVNEFIDVIKGSSSGQSKNLGCPAMNLCRIATFQNFVVATNNLRFSKIGQNNLNSVPEKKAAAGRLWNARNYACCKDMLEDMTDMSDPAQNPLYARIFLCCSGEDRSGLLATVLNTLLFRRNPTRQVTFRLSEDIFGKHQNRFSRKHRSAIKTACQKMNGALYTTPDAFLKEFQEQLDNGALMEQYRDTLLEMAQQPEDNWRINIDYFSDISCQNAYFALNRLFGVFENEPAAAKKFASNGEHGGIQQLRLPAEILNPINVIRVLPIGDMESARLWYEYMRALFQFINDLEPQKFKFYWFNEQRQRKELDDQPNFGKSKSEQPDNYPVLIVIKRKVEPEQKNAQYDDELDKRCGICRQQKVQHSCSHMRAWI